MTEFLAHIRPRIGTVGAALDTLGPIALHAVLRRQGMSKVNGVASSITVPPLMDTSAICPRAAEKSAISTSPISPDAAVSPQRGKVAGTATSANPRRTETQLNKQQKRDTSRTRSNGKIDDLSSPQPHLDDLQPTVPQFPERRSLMQRNHDVQPTIHPFPELTDRRPHARPQTSNTTSETTLSDTVRKGTKTPTDQTAQMPLHPRRMLSALLHHALARRADPVQRPLAPYHPHTRVSTPQSLLSQRAERPISDPSRAKRPELIAALDRHLPIPRLRPANPTEPSHPSPFSSDTTSPDFTTPLGQPIAPSDPFMFEDQVRTTLARILEADLRRHGLTPDREG